MKEYRAATKICVYLSMEGKEIQTSRIVEHALREAKKVFVPYLHAVHAGTSKPRSVMDMLAIHSIEDVRTFQKDKWGIPALPPGSAAGRENCFGGHGVERADDHRHDDCADLDLIVVPGVAFDRRLGRLGHGKGYYDTFLSRCKDRVMDGRSGKMPLLGMYGKIRCPRRRAANQPSRFSTQRADPAGP